MDKEIVHFMKWTAQLSILWNGQNICPFCEMDENSTDHFIYSEKKKFCFWLHFIET